MPRFAYHRRRVTFRFTIERTTHRARFFFLILLFYSSSYVVLFFLLVEEGGKSVRVIFFFFKFISKKKEETCKRHTARPSPCVGVLDLNDSERVGGAKKINKIKKGG